MRGTVRETIAVAPEIGIKLATTPRRRLDHRWLGNFLYISSVLRPGDQIDRSFSKGPPFQQDPAPPAPRVGSEHRFLRSGLTVGA